MQNNYPLIIVFYLDSELMGNPEIIKPFAESVNQMLLVKNANALAFFLPTTGTERVQCINPVQVSETDMSEINKLVEDIKKSFSIETEVAEEIITGPKPCECGNNPNGNCQCD